MVTKVSIRIGTISDGDILCFPKEGKAGERTGIGSEPTLARWPLVHISLI